jgi:hypothetical protein
VITITQSLLLKEEQNGHSEILFDYSPFQHEIWIKAKVRQEAITPDNE